MENRRKNLTKEEKEIINSYFNTFHMYCENDVIKRLQCTMSTGEISG